MCAQKYQVSSLKTSAQIFLKNISSALQKNCDEKLIFFIISVWCVFIVNENDDSFLDCTLLLEFLKKNKHKLTELVSWVKRPI